MDPFQVSVILEESETEVSYLDQTLIYRHICENIARIVEIAKLPGLNYHTSLNTFVNEKVCR